MDMTTTRRGFVLSAASLAVLSPFAALAAAPSGTSVYQLPASLVDQDGRAFELSSLRGAPVLVSMFYTSCQMVCPMIFETIHSTLKALPAADRDAVKVLMVSFDPPRDTVPVLKKTAEARNCDSHWTLARCDEGTARKIAAVLGIQYRRLADGEFNHSTQVALLDRDGRITAKTGKLGSVDAHFVKSISAVVTAHA